MSVTVILPNNRRLTIKATVNTLLSEVLEKICTHQELDSNNYVLRRNNRPVDPSLTLRLASIPLNSELNLVYDANKNVTQPVNISVQYEDRQRRTGQFDPNKTLWDIIATLFQSDCPEVTNDDIVLSINFMNRQFEGKDTLMKTTLKLMGILNGRVALRMNSRDKETKVTQKFVENIIFKKTKPVQEPEVQCKEPETKVEAPVSSAKQETLKTDPEPSCSNEEHRKAEPADFQTKNNNLVQKNSILDHLKDLKQSKSDHKPIDQSAPSPKEKGVEPKLEVLYLDGSNEEILYSIDDCPNFVEENLSDDFFELNPGDLRHLLTQLRRQQKAGENENLEVRKTREERERKEREKFDQTIIRIIFPYDRLALQVIFKPNDTIEMVTNLVRRYINVDNFYLFTAPPKTILSNNLKLVDLNMVPSGSIYCGSATTGICLVQEQFKTKINSFLAASQLASRQIKAMYQKLK